MSHVCHDFKTPRVDGSRRLPQIFILVPILFYVIFFGGAYLGFNSYKELRNARKERDDSKALAAELDARRLKFDTDLQNVLKEKWKAERLAMWVEGTRGLQPISVAVVRALPPEITIGEFSLERVTELPQQVGMTVLINNGSLEDIARIQTAMSELHYRPFNSQQLKSGDALEYKSTLVWQ